MSTTLTYICINIYIYIYIYIYTYIYTTNAVHQFGYNLCWDYMLEPKKRGYRNRPQHHVTFDDKSHLGIKMPVPMVIQSMLDVSMCSTLVFPIYNLIIINIFCSNNIYIYIGESPRLPTPK